MLDGLIGGLKVLIKIPIFSLLNSYKNIIFFKIFQKTDLYQKIGYFKNQIFQKIDFFCKKKRFFFKFLSKYQFFHFKIFIKI